MALDASIMCYSEINVRTLAISLAWRVAGNVQCGLFRGSGSPEAEGLSLPTAGAKIVRGGAPSAVAYVGFSKGGGGGQKI